MVFLEALEVVAVETVEADHLALLDKGMLVAALARLVERALVVVVVAAQERLVLLV